MALPSWVIPAIGTAIGTGFSMKGASDAQNAQNKAIKAQNKYDHQVWKYNKGQAEAQHEFNKNEVEIARANNENELRFREAIDLQNYTEASRQRLSDFRSQVQAYRASNQDYRDYKGLNQDIASQARRDTLNKFREQRAALGFNNQRQKLEDFEKIQDLGNLMRGAKADYRSARKDSRLATQRANRAYSQAIDQVGIDNRRTRANRASTRGEKRLRKLQFEERRGLERLKKDKQLDDLTLTKDRQELAKNQAVAQAEEAYADAQLAKNQAVDSITARFDRANQKLDQSDRRFDQSFIEQELANTNQKTRLDAEYEDSRLQGEFNDKRSELTFKSAEDNISDKLEDQRLNKNQATDELTDQQLYQIFEVEGNLESLQGVDGNGGELEVLKLRYESEKATKEFEQEAKMFEGLAAEGAQLARGQRGKTATKNVASVMAAIGREQAQLADSILRASAIYDSQKKSIEDKIARAKTLKGMYEATTKRKKTDLTETFERQEKDKTRLTGQAKSTKDLDLEVTESLRERAEKRRDREKGFIDSTQKQQEARRDLEKAFNAEDLNLNKLDEVRLVADEQETLDRVKIRTDRQAQDARDSFDLDQRAFDEATAYVKEEWESTKRSLSNEQKLMVNSLNNQLKQYGIDLSANNKARRAALQNFKTAQTANQNAIDAAESEYGIETTQIRQDKANANANAILRKSEYQASITSAKKARSINLAGIRLDEYSANLTADKQRMVEPQLAPRPPKPIIYPRTHYQNPMKPGTPPKPVKGAVQSGAIFQAFGSGLGKLMGINWSNLAPQD